MLQYLDLELLTDRAVALLARVAGACVVAAAFWLVIALARRLLTAALRHRGVPAGATGLLIRFARYALFVLAVLTVLDQLGVNVTSLIAGLGIAGLAVSFAAQDTVANLIAGVTLAIDRPFKEGDWISLAGTHAMVTEMRLRTTVLTTFDNETLVVPNKALAQERIVNYTLTPRIRARIPLRVGLDADVAAARRVLLELVAADPRVLTDPAPVVIVTQVGQSSMELELRIWSEDPLLKFPLAWEYAESGTAALERAGIRIPVPRYRVDVAGDLEPERTGATQRRIGA